MRRARVAAGSAALLLALGGLAGCGGVDPPPTDPLPTTRPDYADATIQAWRSGDAQVLAEYAAPAAASALASRDDLRDDGWERVETRGNVVTYCGPVGSSIGRTCLDVTVDAAAAVAGDPHAVTRARIYEVD